MTTNAEPIPQLEMNRSSTSFASEEQPFQEIDLEKLETSEEAYRDKYRCSSDWADACDCCCSVLQCIASCLLLPCMCCAE
ncbi:hypothetical protein RSAG8_13939, partial [Rhizoctonia solani AG-8 WAC10335]